jgi:glycosyltransferase involved in cell wall biosynthesis
VSGRRLLKIVMTADAVGGVWQYATDLSAALAAEGHQIVLALLGPKPSPDQRRRADSIEGLRVIDTGLPLDWLCTSPEPVVEAARAVAALAREENADLVHCNMPTLAGAADFTSPVVAVTHGCVATWWQAAKNEPLASDYRWHREMMRQGLASADAVVAPSTSYAATIKGTYRLPALPRVVHNGREAVAVERQGEPIWAALTVGRLWDAVKNAALLDRVAVELPVPFLAAGAQRGPHGETVPLSHLVPLGELDGGKLAALLARRPVFVSAATFEPFGLAVLEAAAAGCSLVLSDIPTFRELWDGVAVFADPHDPSSFTTAVADVIAAPADRQALGDAAARRAARFTPSATAAAMTSIYAELLGEREAAA